jgi:hypothetical protein
MSPSAAWGGRQGGNGENGGNGREEEARGEGAFVSRQRRCVGMLRRVNRVKNKLRINATQAFSM